MADDIHDTGPQGEPRKLQELKVRFSCVVHLPLLHRARCVRSVGTPDLQQVRQKRGDATVEPLCGTGLLVENGNLQILVDPRTRPRAWPAVTLISKAAS